MQNRDIHVGGVGRVFSDGSKSYWSVIILTDITGLQLVMYCVNISNFVVKGLYQIWIWIQVRSIYILGCSNCGIKNQTVKTKYVIV